MIRIRRRPPFSALATTVGTGLELVGELRVDNQGELHIGNDVVLVSRPGITHLFTGPSATMHIGHRVRIGHGSALAAVKRVEIGDGAVLGSFVMVMDTDFHIAGEIDATPDPQPVTIGNGARIGHSAVILPGVSVGAGAIVEPGAVVAGRVADGAHVAGNPAVPRAAAARGHGAQDVADVIAEVFGLERPPAADVGPNDLPEWDSLGALRVLIALEVAFGIVLDDRCIAEAGSVGDLERVVAAAAAAVT
jgi:acetyltransferase-like isoleucine patch superfamily enzyme/acyl carrier protein